jgi:hypothetical protein
MSKCFLVSTHLRYPELKLLDLDCQVGDGASESFRYLYRSRTKARARKAAEDTAVFTIDPSLPKAKQEQLYRQGLLWRLHAYLGDNMERVEPVLAPMIAWSAKQAQEVFEGVIPPAVLTEKMSIYDLQVNLCE